MQLPPALLGSGASAGRGSALPRDGLCLPEPTEPPDRSKQQRRRENRITG